MPTFNLEKSSIHNVLLPPAIYPVFSINFTNEWFFQKEGHLLREGKVLKLYQDYLRHTNQLLSFTISTDFFPFLPNDSSSWKPTILKKKEQNEDKGDNEEWYLSHSLRAHISLGDISDTSF